jgi:hypothetical protein
MSATRPGQPRDPDPVPKLSPRRAERRDDVVLATLGPFVCTWDDLPQVERRRAAHAPGPAVLPVQLLSLGALLLSLTAPLS